MCPAPKCRVHVWLIVESGWEWRFPVFTSFMDAGLTLTNWRNFLENSKTVHTGRIIQFSGQHKNVFEGMTEWP